MHKITKFYCGSKGRNSVGRLSIDNSAKSRVPLGADVLAFSNFIDTSEGEIPTLTAISIAS